MLTALRIADNYLRLTRFYSQHSSLPSRAAYCDLDPDVKDPFGQPVLRITHEWTDYDRRSVEYFMTIKRPLGSIPATRPGTTLLGLACCSNSGTTVEQRSSLRSGCGTTARAT